MSTVRKLDRVARTERLLAKVRGRQLVLARQGRVLASMHYALLARRVVRSTPRGVTVKIPAALEFPV